MVRSFGYVGMALCAGLKSTILPTPEFNKTGIIVDKEAEWISVLPKSKK